GESGRARRLYNNFPQSIPSPFSNKPAELLVRAHQDSLRPVYVLDSGWPRSWSFSLHLSRHVGSTQSQSCAWKDASSLRGILDVGRCFCDQRAPVYSFNANGFAFDARSGKFVSILW